MKVRFMMGSKVSEEQDMEYEEAHYKAMELAVVRGREVILCAYDEKKKVFVKHANFSKNGNCKILCEISQPTITTIDYGRET